MRGNGAAPYSALVSAGVGSALGIACLVVLGAAMAVNRSLWLDESMLLASVDADPWLPPGVELSRYEQALPYGSYLILKLVATLGGVSETALRLPIMLAWLIGVLLTFAAARRVAGPALAAVAVAGCVLAYNSVTQATMFKHYAFEFLATAVLILIAAELDRRPRLGIAVGFTAASALAVVFSNGAVFVSIAIALIVLLRHLPEIRRSARARIFAAVLGAGYLLWFVVWYLLVIRPSSAAQFENRSYELAGLDSFIASLLGTTQYTGQTLGPALSWTPWVVVGVALVLAAERRRLMLWPAVLAVVVGLCGLAALVGVAPFLTPRHLLFVTPVVALAVATGLAATLGRLRVRAAVRWAARATAVVVVAVLAVPAVQSARTLIEETRPLYSAAEDECPKLWTYYGAQPATEVYAPVYAPSVPVIGTVPVDSAENTIGWTWQIRESYPSYIEASVELVTGEPEVCLVIAHAYAGDDVALLAAFRDAGAHCGVLRREFGAELYHCRTAAASATNGSDSPPGWL